MVVKNLFFDMDGTLFEWNELSEGMLWILNTATYYTLLKPQMQRLVGRLSKDPRARLWICSVAFTKDAQEGKNLALDASYKDRFPLERRVYVPRSISKADAVVQHLGRELTENDILLDDHSANLFDWEEKGGMAFKVLNGINGLGEKWPGRRMTLDGYVKLSSARESRMDEDGVNRLIYAIYEDAVSDYIRLRQTAEGPKALKKLRELEAFLKKDPFGFGTGRIRKKLGIGGC